MPADDVTVLLNARDAATPVIDAVEARVRKLSTSGDLGTVLSFAKVKGAISVVSQAFDGLATVIDRVRADGVDGLSDAIREIPLLGGLVQSADSLIGALTGANAEIAKLNEQAKEQERIAAARDAAQVGIENIQRELDIRGAIAQLTDQTEIQVAQLYARQAAEQEKISRMLEDRDLSGRQRAAIEEAAAESERVAQLEINKILDERAEKDREAAQEKLREADEAAKKQLDAAQKKLQEADEEAKKQLDAARTRAAALQSLDDEIAVKRLRMIGQAEAAEIESIKRRYDARIKAAEDADDVETANRLKSLRQMDLAEAEQKQPGPAMTTRAQLSALESRFLSRAPGTSEVDIAKQTASNTATMAKAMQASNTWLARIASTIGRDIAEGIGL